jgi:uncharacterized membrane protein
MDAKYSKICRMLVIIATVALAGWFTAMANAMLVTISIIAGSISFYLCKTSVEEIVEDERDERVSERASKSAMGIFTAMAAFAGIILIALRNGYPEYTQIGFTLAFSACALMILYSILYGYYNKIYGYESYDEE